VLDAAVANNINNIEAVFDCLIVSREHEDELHLRVSLVQRCVEHIARNVVGTTESVALRIWP
jgi:hypothetical protein